MKIFLDTANIPAIKKWASTGLIDGVTTNPTHLSKEGNDPKKQVLEICALLPNGEISVEVTEQEPQAVYAQARTIAALAPNIVVKIPCSSIYFETIKKLVSDDIKLNITLLFSLPQALMMCKMGVQMISPFIGRLEDIDVEGVELIPELRDMVEMYGYETQILAASVRSVRQLHKCITAGADIVTLPVELFEKAIEHPLTTAGIAKFDADWRKSGLTL